MKNRFAICLLLVFFIALSVKEASAQAASVLYYQGSLGTFGYNYIPISTTNPLPVTFGSAGVTVNIGTSTSATNPRISGDATSGLYTSGAGNVSLAIGGNNIFSASSAGTVFNTSTAVTPSTVAITTSTFTPSFAASNSFNVLLTAACPCTLANPSGTIVPGTDITISVQQSSGGSNTITSYGTFYKFSGGTSPTLSTTANALDIFACHVWSTTDLICGVTQNFIP